MLAVVEAVQNGVDDQDGEAGDAFGKVVEAVDDGRHGFEACYFFCCSRRSAGIFR